VHARTVEEKFVAEGWGVRRFDVMYNDFVVAGPKDDPAGVAGSGDVVAAFHKIAASAAPFASRGDDSGTHKAELKLWQAADVDVEAASGGWYRETGSGMGSTLNAAGGMGAYVLTDRATWISFNNKQDLAIAVQGDARLFNQYGVMLVNPARHPHVKERDARAFIAWLTGAEGQTAIAAFKLGGEPLFFPNARKAGS
jgi:tungstate transport system substrate-binding protein